MARSDAQANRAKILETARQALLDDGETSLNRIAQRAGVGAGTLYRHFPNRDALVLAVYEDEVTGIVEDIPARLADATPREALRDWTIELVTAMRRKHGLGDALSPSAHQAIAEQTYAPVIAAITLLLDAGKRDGSIRADADAGDFLQLTGALWRASPGPVDRAERMLDLILDGLTPPDRRR
ncbi:TetR/AcrR family transcriptional regulator [Tsukamurella ocularis]|uniref:TetR/AcrR family transcriptional regulator n=1 Tax=Tsukamurella ocularis TaxID=1970234 RepID=UPI002169DD72|nr:TetR/AcrR family transcriptional regulator [Tsukamurella ocularis]MCS3780414.1 AcrR family transcriptional regulator [Tsukamurella ocularis]MCS3786031.1 AcrR family transcriptional regulator [Tsukamurella ocularis]MCS3849395.1 AcrR family transcriptional regulator [Tsukamurella ocularis]